MICPTCGRDNLPGEDFCEKCGNDLAAEDSVPEPRLGRLHDLILKDPLSQLNARSPITLRESDMVSKAVEVMRKQRFGSVLVLDDEGKLSGIFTERDLLQRLSDHVNPLDQVRLGSTMTRNPQTLREDDTIALALNRMSMGGYRHVPIVRDDRPVGFVSIRGILKYIAKNALNS